MPICAGNCSSAAYRRPPMIPGRVARTPPVPITAMPATTGAAKKAPLRSSSATCGALVVVGYLMMSDIGKIDWGSLEAAIPAFVTIMGIPFTYSITNGIGFGFITYVVVKVTQGHWRDVKPLMWIVSAAFLFTFVAFS